jgi:hypothetical protein
MPLEDLNRLHYSEAEKTTVTAAITNIENSLSEKFKNLKPEERMKYGSVSEQNKLFINKVKDLETISPQ